MATARTRRSTAHAPSDEEGAPSDAHTADPVTSRPDRRVKVAITVTDADGTSRRHYFRGRTKREARAKAEAARQRVAAGAPVRDASCTLGEWLEEWRDTFLRASDRAESTKVLYTGLTRHHVEPVIGHLELHQIRPTDVTRVLLAMQEAGKAASTRRNGYAGLRSCLDDAVANGLPAGNPVLRVKRSSRPSAAGSMPSQFGRCIRANAASDELVNRTPAVDQSPSTA